mmetsp:Transcript_37210/g.124652  ORF Transcript_37210/g.124652 Transcript_37210/m.124652 type:complete len:146 (+) Transcript_37210:247-684(+)
MGSVPGSGACMAGERGGGMLEALPPRPRCGFHDAPASTSPAPPLAGMGGGPPGRQSHFSPAMARGGGDLYRGGGGGGGYGGKGDGGGYGKGGGHGMGGGDPMSAPGQPGGGGGGFPGLQGWQAQGRHEGPPPHPHGYVKRGWWGR